MDWMLLPLKRYFDFSGRSRRLEFWLFTVFIWAILIIEMVLLSTIGTALGVIGDKGQDSVFAGLFGLILLATWGFLFIPWLAAFVRRLHDSDKSGLWLLIYFLPFGGLVLLVFLFLDGTEGENSFGENPKEESSVRQAEIFA